MVLQNFIFFYDITSNDNLKICICFHGNQMDFIFQITLTMDRLRFPLNKHDLISNQLLLREKIVRFKQSITQKENLTPIIEGFLNYYGHYRIEKIIDLVQLSFFATNLINILCS